MGTYLFEILRISNSFTKKDKILYQKVKKMKYIGLNYL
jgi:hypothetical protein